LSSQEAHGPPARPTGSRGSGGEKVARRATSGEHFDFQCALKARKISGRTFGARINRPIDPEVSPLATFDPRLQRAELAAFDPRLQRVKLAPSVAP